MRQSVRRLVQSSRHITYRSIIKTTIYCQSQSCLYRNGYDSIVAYRLTNETFFKNVDITRFGKRHLHHLKEWLQEQLSKPRSDDEEEEEEFLLPRRPEEPWGIVSSYPPEIRDEVEPSPPKPEPELEPIKLPRQPLTKRPITTEDVRRLFGHDYQAYLDFMREARVERNSTLGELLVDYEDIKHDYEYWLQLLKFRARMHGSKGVKDVWRGMRLRNVLLPVRHDVANNTWRIFVDVGLQDEAFLEEIWRYSEDVYENENGRKWKGLYVSIVGSYMETAPEKAIFWHERLIHRHWPRQLVNFFKGKAAVQSNLTVLFRIFSTKKTGNLYNTIIPFLCRQKQYQEALKWNKMLFQKKDVPTDSSSANLLFEYLSLHDSVRSLEEFLQMFIDQKINIVESSFVAMIKNRKRCLDIMEIICKYYSSGLISNNAFGELFWPLLLSYREFPESLINGYMSRLGIEHVGDATAREFVKRATTIGSFIRKLALLKKGRFTPNSELFDRMLQLRAKVEPDKVLETALSYHVLELNRGNAILKGYVEAFQWKHFNFLYERLMRKDARTWNLFLRKLFMTRQIESALEAMEEMRVASIPISSGSIQALLRAMLVKRRRRRHPTTYDSRGVKNLDLITVVNLLKAILINGGFIQPHFWLEIIKRLGMAKKLKILERLSLWLVDWYHPGQPKLRNHIAPIKFSLSGDDWSSPISGAALLSKTPTEIPSTSIENPLRKLFPKQTIRAFVEWGFLALQRALFLHRSVKKKPLVNASKTALFTWGIRLARKLQDKGVQVDQRSIARAVRIRLRALDGSRRDWESFDLNMSRRREVIDLAVIGITCEKAWGKRLFPRGSWNSPEGLASIVYCKVKDEPDPSRRRRRRGRNVRFNPYNM